MGEGMRGAPRRAAVLLIFYPQNGQPYLVFTRRTERVATHKGQISFPGGAIDPCDASELAAALRETQEELGIDPQHLRLIGKLEPVYTVVTNWLIAPFLAVARSRPTYIPEPVEVAEVIEVPVAAFLDPVALRVEHWDDDGVSRAVYFYSYERHVIWGATARILKQFLDRRFSEDWWHAVMNTE